MPRIDAPLRELDLLRCLAAFRADDDEVLAQQMGEDLTEIGAASLGLASGT